MTTPTPLDQLRERLPDSARDTRLNLEAVLRADGPLSPAQRWGTAVTAAATARNPEVLAAVRAAALENVGNDVVDDALAAASLMAMNNVFYRFRHLIGKPSYLDRPARLRMNRLVKPLTSKVDFELFSLAASAINGCETCVRAHEKVVVDGGLTEEHIHEAVRVASVVHAVAVSLEFA